LRAPLRKLEEIVIGSGLNAAAYSYIKNVPLILNSAGSPFEFSYLDPEVKLDKIGLKNIRKELSTPDGVKLVGLPKADAWRYVVYMLSLSGLCPLADKTEAIRVEEGRLTVTTASSRVIKLDFDKLTVFDDKNVHGLPTLPKESGRLKVIDWINVRSGMKHEFDQIEAASDFVRRIHFYPSERIDGDSNKKDAVAISYMSEEELNDYKYSDTYVKFKVREIMKNAGINGKKNGFDYKGDQKHVDIKLEPSRREIKKDEEGVYEDTKSIKFVRKTAEEVIAEIEEIRTKTYTARLRELFNGKRD
jgi:hypothetical protein